MTFLHSEAFSNLLFETALFHLAKCGSLSEIASLLLASSELLWFCFCFSLLPLSLSHIAKLIFLFPHCFSLQEKLVCFASVWFLLRETCLIKRSLQVKSSFVMNLVWYLDDPAHFNNTFQEYHILMQNHEELCKILVVESINTKFRTNNYFSFGIYHWEWSGCNVK